MIKVVKEKSDSSVLKFRYVLWFLIAACVEAACLAYTMKPEWGREVPAFLEFVTYDMSLKLYL